MNLSSAAARFTPPMVSVSIILGGWWLLTASGTVPSYLLPTPGDVGSTFWLAVTSDDLLAQMRSTVRTTLFGYGSACILAFSLSVAIALSKTFDQIASPVIIVFQSIPKIALGPLLFIWIGFGESAIIILAMLASYFPILVNTLAGLRLRNPDIENLYLVHGASRWRVLVDIRIPSAARHIFSGLELAVVFALIGNIVMEFLIGTQGLGFVIQDSANRVDLPLNFSAILLLGGLGMTLALLVRTVGRKVVFWEGDRVGKQNA